MGKYKKADRPLKDSREIRRENESERRSKEKETIDKIRDIVPFIKKNNGKFIKKEFLRSLAGYVKFLHTFNNTAVQPFPSDFDGVFHSLLRSDAVNVFVCDGDLNIIFCSELAFKNLGYQQKDVICRKLPSLVYERDRLAFEREISALKKEIVESISKNPKDFNITCRMIMKKNSRNAPDKYHLVRITGTIEYRKDLVTKKVAIEKAKNTHLSIRREKALNHDSAILIRGSIELLKNPNSLSSQIDYMFVNKNEYRLVMNPAGKIVYGCHRMVSIIGFQPEEVIGRSAYEFIFEDDRQVSLYAHSKTLANSEGTGVIVHRVLDVNKKFVYLQSTGRLEYTDDTILFHTIATPLSEEEGEKQRRAFVEQLEPYCRSKSIKHLQAQVNTVAEEKLTQLTNQIAAAKIDSSADTDSRLQPSTSTFSPPSTPIFFTPSTSAVNSSFHSVSDESNENELIDITSITSTLSSPLGPSSSFASQLSPLSTSSSSIPALSASSSPSSIVQSTSSQSQSPPTNPFPSQFPTQESQSHFLSNSTLLTMPSSTSISINYPVYTNPPIVMRPTNEHLIQNQYQIETHNHYNIIITTQPIPEQPTLFSVPVNQQIILQPSFSQYPTYNYQDNSGPIIQNIVGLDVNAELQRVNVDDFVCHLDSESEQDFQK